MPKKREDTIRCAKFEVYRILDDENKEAYPLWFELQDQCRKITNTIWSYWFNYHIQNGSEEKIKNWLNKKKEWETYKTKLNVWNNKKKRDRGKKPEKPRGDSKIPFPVLSVPKDLSKQIYHVISEGFPNVCARTRTLIQNQWNSSMKKNAINVPLKIWIAILLGFERIPNSIRDLPIPFDVENGPKKNKQSMILISPNEGNENYVMQLRLYRIPPKSKVNGENKTHRFEIRSNGNKVRTEIQKLQRMLSGEYKLKGSKLLWNTSKKKWFVHLSYTLPPKEKVVLDDRKIATLIPHSQHPITLKTPDGRTHWLVGRGYPVAAIREKIFMTRRNRNNAYRNASVSSKGHGRKRMGNWRWKFEKSWQEFVKRMNNYITTRAVRRCVEDGIGLLVYFQPEGEFSDSRFLSTSGKHEDWNDQTTWGYYQIKKMLEDKCEEAGINFSVIKTATSIWPPKELRKVG